MRSGQAISGKLEHETREDGHDTWVLTSKFPWHDSRGRIRGTFGVSSDVTELVTRIKVSLPSSYPHKQSLARFAGHALALPP